MQSSKLKLGMSWAFIFRALRGKMGASQYDFSRLTGFSQSMIARIESGKKEPGFSELCRLSEIFHTNMEELSQGQFYTAEALEHEIQMFGLRPVEEPEYYMLSRAIEPILIFVLEYLGDKRIIELLEMLELKEDIFVFRDSKIAVDKVHVLMSTLLNEKILEKPHLKELARLSLSERVLGEKTHHILNYEKSPVQRLKMLFTEYSTQENFSNINLLDPQRAAIKLNRFFRISKQKRKYSFKGLIDDFDRHVWCDFFHFYLQEAIKGDQKFAGFNIFKPKCQWKGNIFCSYQLEFDV